MYSKEEFDEYINGVKDKINDTDSALLSEDFINIKSNYNTTLETIDNLQKENEALKKDNDALIKANGRLFQQVGHIPSNNAFPDNNESLEPKKILISINDFINEKGDLFNAR